MDTGNAESAEKVHEKINTYDQYSFRESATAVWELLRMHKRRLYYVLAFGVLSAATGALIPLLVGHFLDALNAAADSSAPAGVRAALVALGVWLGVQVLNQSVGWVQQYLGRDLPEQFMHSVHQRSVAQLLRMPMSFHKTHKLTEIREVVNRASGMLAGVINVLIQIATSLLSVVIGIVIAFTIHVGLALILLAGAAVYTLVVARVVRTSAHRHRDAIEAWTKAFGVVYGPLHNVETTKISSAEEHEHARAREACDEAMSTWSHMENVWTRVDAFQRAVILSVQGSIFAAAVWLVLGGELTIGQLVAFNGYALMFLGPLVQIGLSWQQIQNGFAAAAALRARVLHAPTEEYRPPGAVELDVAGNVHFKDVTFRYEDGDTDVLQDVNFSATAGETIALVGESGGGKSTLISLLLAFYFPTKGTVAVDGTDTRTLDLTHYRSQVAVVPQEVALFNDTVENNVKYGRFGATHEEVVAATRVAQAEGFIEKLPKGYETLVGERGVKLSVGQKQRVAVARAVLRDPEILILDEPTSALDSKTERDLTTALEQLMQGRTTFIIAHRLSTVRKADKIIVLKDGRVAEIGPHDTLMQRESGVYRQLYEQHVGLRE